MGKIEVDLYVDREPQVGFAFVRLYSDGAQGEMGRLSFEENERVLRNPKRLVES